MRDNNIRDVRQISLQGLFVWGTIAPNVDLMLMIYIYIYNIYIYIHSRMGQPFYSHARCWARTSPSSLAGERSRQPKKKIVQRH